MLFLAILQLRSVKLFLLLLYLGRQLSLLRRHVFAHFLHHLVLSVFLVILQLLKALEVLDFVLERLGHQSMALHLVIHCLLEGGECGLHLLTLCLESQDFGHLRLVLRGFRLPSLRLFRKHFQLAEHPLVDKLLKVLLLLHIRLHRVLDDLPHPILKLEPSDIVLVLQNLEFRVLLQHRPMVTHRCILSAQVLLQRRLGPRTP